MSGRGGGMRGRGRGAGVGDNRGFRGGRDFRDRDRGGGGNRRRGYDNRYPRDSEDNEGRERYRGDHGNRYREDDGDRYRGDQRERGELSGGENQENQMAGGKPIVLAKSVRVLEREKMERDFPALSKPDIKSNPSEGEEPGEVSGVQGETANMLASPGMIMVKQRSAVGRSDSPAAPGTSSGTSSTQQARPSIKREEKTVLKQRSAIKLLDESQSFCDGIADYLTDNQDFLVVGVIGLQSTGKSTLLNIVAKNSPEDDEIFRVQSFEHQMLGEHCTNGIDVYVNSRRHIFLDCQPLMSASVLDRSVQLEKKNALEYTSSENTIEVNSLQLVGFMFSVCHVVVLVQDWFIDFSLIRLIQAAETLKPVQPTSSGEDNQVIEYFPNLVLVHNKCEVADFEEDSLEEIRECYSMAWAKSRLNWRCDGSDKPQLILLPDHEGERADSLSFRIRPRVDIERAGRQLRHQVLNMPRRNLTQTKLSERGWVNLANKTWDNIRNSAFYMEYSRLLP